VRTWFAQAGLQVQHEEALPGASPELPVLLLVATRSIPLPNPPKGKRP
jgi:hypothetical protein